MHMPDGILPLNQAIVYLSISIVVILIAVWQARKTLIFKQIPIIGVLGAAIFALQMFNFPVPFGSSGHLIGTTLATTLLGPWVSILIIASILIVQAMFGDGGLLAYGANVLNMAIIGSLVTWAIFYLVPRTWKQSKNRFAIIAGIAGFISPIFMAIAASIELTIAQAGPAHLIFAWMVGLHAIIGLAEGLITAAIIRFAFQADPALLEVSERSLYMQAIQEPVPEGFKIPKWTFILTFGAFVAMSLFGLVASQNPDGLERTFEVLGIEGADSGILSFGEGLGWDILQMAVVMISLFLILIAASYLYYRIQTHRASQASTTQSTTSEKSI